MSKFRWRPKVTVAAIIERAGSFLLVEEQTSKGALLNHPSGHLELGESPESACAREALEETKHLFRPTALVGLYLWCARDSGQSEDNTQLRFAFCGDLGQIVPSRPFDSGIIRTLWMTPDEVRASILQHRSPLVLQAMEDYLRGQRYPLELIWTNSLVTGADL